MSSSHRWTRLLLVALIVLLHHSVSALAKQVTLRPLESAEIRALEHPVAKGRSVASGLAGFVLGLGKALTGVFIYDVITANITESEETNASANSGSFREVCFNTGSSNSDITCLVYYANN